jgi:hypothetical protein
MRMWRVAPDLMCRNHLLGEHLELHTFASRLCTGKNVDGYIRNGLLEPARLFARHEQLVAEMDRRGLRHHTPMTEIERPELPVGKIDLADNIRELARRCDGCLQRIRRDPNARVYLS